MSILTANLKHLYQRRVLWLIFVLLGLMAFVNIMAVMKPKAGKGVFVFFAVICLSFMGFMAASMQIEVLNKPFSFCLPGHRRIVRQVMFVIGILVSLLYSLIFLRYPGLDLWQLLLVILSAFSACLIFFWLGAGDTFLTNDRFGNSWTRWAGLLPFIFIFGMLFGLHKILENMIIQYPVIFIIIGVLSSILVWRWLGDDDIARQFCARPLLGIFTLWDRNKIQKYSQAEIAAKGDKIFRNTPQVEQFFLARMLKCTVLGAGRYIWGGLYTTF